MLERLQTVQRGSAESVSIVQPTQLVIDDEYAAIVAEYVRTAESEIRICAYDWRWYEMEPELGIQKLNVELFAARHRGVRVRVLVDNAVQVAKLAALGFDARSVMNTRMLHTKALCFDARTIVIGSHNMTKRAITQNYEMSLINQEPQVVLGFIDYFDRMWDSRG